MKPIDPAEPPPSRPDITALTRVSMLIGFCVGVLVTSGVWGWILWGLHRRP